MSDFCLLVSGNVAPCGRAPEWRRGAAVSATVRATSSTAGEGLRMAFNGPMSFADSSMHTEERRQSVTVDLQEQIDSIALNKGFLRVVAAGSKGCLFPFCVCANDKHIMGISFLSVRPLFWPVVCHSVVRSLSH